MRRVSVFSRHFSTSARSFADAHQLTSSVTHCKPSTFTPHLSLISEVNTPACIVNLDAVMRNCARVNRLFDGLTERQLRLRAHVKTHKTLEIASMQCSGHATKRIEVSTLNEAWYFAQSGLFDDLLVRVTPRWHRGGRVFLASCRHASKCLKTLLNVHVSPVSTVSSMRFTRVRGGELLYTLIKLTTGSCT